MADRPLVSVLLPVRNAAARLPAALDSLQAQTQADFEVVAVDDGSDDDGATWAVLAAYAAGDGRIRPLSAPRRGIAPALNLAVEQARGRLLARMDADDTCHPERLALQAAYLADNPATGVVTCQALFGGDPDAAGGFARHVAWQNGLLTHEAMALGVFRETPAAHPTVLARREVFARLGGYRHGPFPEDYELWLRWIEGGVRLAKLPRPLYVWNDPPGRLSRTDPRYAPEAFFALKAGYLARWLAAHNPLHPDIWVVGAGRVTRRRAEHLTAHGVRIAGYLDIDPRKVGRSPGGRPVLHHREAGEPGERFVVSYVATPGAADHVAAFLEGRGFVAGRHFILAA